MRGTRVVVGLVAIALAGSASAMGGMMGAGAATMGGMMSGGSGGMTGGHGQSDSDPAGGHDHGGASPRGEALGSGHDHGQSAGSPMPMESPAEESSPPAETAGSSGRPTAHQH
jgi:hypothetical protein